MEGDFDQDAGMTIEAGDEASAGAFSASSRVQPRFEECNLLTFVNLCGNHAIMQLCGLHHKVPARRLQRLVAGASSRMTSLDDLPKQINGTTRAVHEH